jgi:hypothetical protein
LLQKADILICYEQREIEQRDDPIALAKAMRRERVAPFG